MGWSAMFIIQKLFASVASEVSPYTVMRWPPSARSIVSGFAGFRPQISRPSWNPGPRQPSQRPLSPKAFLVSLSPP